MVWRTPVCPYCDAKLKRVEVMALNPPGTNEPMPLESEWYCNRHTPIVYFVAFTPTYESPFSKPAAFEEIRA